MYVFAFYICNPSEIFIVIGMNWNVSLLAFITVYFLCIESKNSLLDIISPSCIGLLLNFALFSWFICLFFCQYSDYCNFIIAWFNICLWRNISMYRCMYTCACTHTLILSVPLFFFWILRLLFPRWILEKKFKLVKNPLILSLLMHCIFMLVYETLAYLDWCSFKIY